MEKVKFLKVFFLILICCQLIAASALAETDWKLSLLGTYATGKYGGSTSVDTWYLPLTLKRYFDKGDVSLTIPYISQKSTNEVTVIDGATFKKPRPSRITSVTTNSGLGDIILKGSYYLLTEQPDKQPLDLFIVGKIKFPTADSNKNLGTGEFDETAGLELGKTFLPQWKLFADAYYTLIGSPPGIELKNRFLFDAGIMHNFTPFLDGSVFYEESTPLIDGISDERDVAANIEYKIAKEFSIIVGGSVGLTNSTYDYTVTGGLAYRF